MDHTTNRSAAPTQSFEKQANVAVAMMDDGLHGAPKTAPRTAPETAPMALLFCGLAFVFAIYVVYCMRYVPSTMDALFIIAQPLSFLLVDATWNWTYGKPRQVSCAALSAAGLAYLAITYLSAPSEPWIWCVLVASQIAGIAVSNCSIAVQEEQDDPYLPKM